MNYIYKRANNDDKMALVVNKKDADYFLIKLNKYNATLLLKVLIFVTRYMYYHRVEKINLYEYFDKEDFDEYYYSLRIFMHLINLKCKENFKEYKEYQIIKNEKQLYMNEDNS